MKKILCNHCEKLVKDIYRKIDGKVICISCERSNKNVETNSYNPSTNVAV